MLMMPNFTQYSLSSYKWPPPTLLTYLDLSLSVEHRPSTTTCQRTHFSLSLFPVVPCKLQCPITSCFCVSPLSHPLGIPLQSLPRDVGGCFPQGVTNPVQNLFTNWLLFPSLPKLWAWHFGLLLTGLLVDNIYCSTVY